MRTNAEICLKMIQHCIIVRHVFYISCAEALKLILKLMEHVGDTQTEALIGLRRTLHGKHVAEKQSKEKWFECHCCKLSIRSSPR